MQNRKSNPSLTLLRLCQRKAPPAKAFRFGEMRIRAISVKGSIRPGIRLFPKPPEGEARQESAPSPAAPGDPADGVFFARAFMLWKAARNGLKPAFPARFRHQIPNMPIIRHLCGFVKETAENCRRFPIGKVPATR
jgi:hypothetical protein